ncbi:hypothetical protein SynM161_02096 [Synechococcus sp. M16.1]|nr:hypothetical protein SynM161_02096 [Synechococcus sp. M16.1]
MNILFLVGSLNSPFFGVESLILESLRFQNPSITIIGNFHCSFDLKSLSHVTLINRADPTNFHTLISSADVIVSHAGIGCTTHLMRLGRQFLCVPRSPLWYEHIDDHQLQWSSLLLQWRIIPSFSSSQTISSFIDISLVDSSVWIESCNSFLDFYFDWDAQGHCLDSIIAEML